VSCACRLVDAFFYPHLVRLFLQIPRRKRRLSENSYCSLGETTTFQICPVFSEFFGLSWETSALKNYHPEDSGDSGSSTQQSLLLAFVISDLQDLLLPRFSGPPRGSQEDFLGRVPKRWYHRLPVAAGPTDTRRSRESFQLTDGSARRIYQCILRSLYC